MSWLTKVLVTAASICIAVTPALADRAPAEHLFGPSPSWNDYRQIGEAAIAQRLLDPESARITWLSGYYKGDFKPFLSPRITGYVACGSVNAKNRLGGYTGATVFVVVIDYGRALFADMDNRGGGAYETFCAKAIGTGEVPPPPVDRVAATSTPMPVSTSPAAPLANVHTGLALRTMQEGAYIAAVVPGSPAASAGLKAGMVVASVNAIPLAGMGDAMLKVIDAAGADAVLTVIGGATIKLGRGK